MSDYFNYKQVLSRQATLNFIIGERGVGKSYGFLKHVIERFLKTSKQFIYLRRYSTEIEDVKQDLFKYHVQNNEFDEHIITYSKDKVLVDGKVAGFLLCLTSEGRIKSKAAFANVESVIYDEFLITNKTQRYINNEPKVLLSFVDSVFRERDPKVYCLGNASSETNPYFGYFNLRIPYQSEFKTYKNGLILVCYSQNQAFREKRRKSKFGQLISGTDYANYAIDNKFLNDNHDFIAKKSNKAWLFACLYLENRNYGLWIDSGTGKMYISTKFDPGNPRAFAITKHDHRETVRLVTIKNSPWFKKMIDCYRQNLLYFENINIKNYVLKAIHPYL